jgi:DNA-binding ferritin-like protein
MLFFIYITRSENMKNYDYYYMYREGSQLSSLNKLFAALLSEKINIMNYSSNALIEQKLNLQENLNELSYIIDDSLEKVKNLIKIKKGYPIFKLDDLDLISPIKTHISQDYKESSIIENINSEIDVLLNIIKDIVSKMSEAGDYDTINVLSSISYDLKTLLLYL